MKFLPINPYQLPKYTTSISVGAGVDQVITALGATAAHIDKALVSSVRKVRAWALTQLARELAAKADITQRSLKRRVYQGLTRTGQTVTATIWIGLRPIAADLVGNPKKLPTGVRVRSHIFHGAFIAAIFSGDTAKVYMRKFRAAGGGKRVGRFPVVRMTIPIAEQMEEILPKYEGPAARKFEEIFEHELKFAMGWFK